MKQAAAKETLTLPEKPLQTDVSAALMTVYPLFLGCAGGMLGYSRVSIVVAGPTGKVTSAKVIDGDYAGTHEGACIEKAVMRAVFPKFALPELTILFRFFLDSEETGIEVFKIPLENQRLTRHRERGGI